MYQEIYCEFFLSISLKFIKKNIKNMIRSLLKNTRLLHYAVTIFFSNSNRIVYTDVMYFGNTHPTLESGGYREYKRNR